VSETRTPAAFVCQVGDAPAPSTVDMGTWRNPAPTLAYYARAASSSTQTTPWAFLLLLASSCLLNGHQEEEEVRVPGLFWFFLKPIVT
jgi:hypothetical protein